MAEILLLTNAFATISMIGLIWFVQIVHYPLFAQVGEHQFAAYERSHQRRTTWVVAPLMLVEGATAIALVFLRPNEVGVMPPIGGAILVGIIWLSTGLIQVPAHERLAKAFTPRTHQVLVLSNWIRTAAWTARGGLVLWMMLARGPAS